MKPSLLSTGLALLAAPISATASSLTPPALPLIVRNPYLSTWLGSARAEPWARWPMFWTGRDIGFSVMAYLPRSGTVVPLLGRPQGSLNGTSTEYTIANATSFTSSFDASVTNLTYSLPSQGGLALALTLSFLSPITPSSTLRQAIPASYLAVHLEGAAGPETDPYVAVYVDVNGDWVTGDRGHVVRWELVNAGNGAGAESGIKSWKVQRATQQLFTEIDDRAEWGQFYLSAPADAHHQAGESTLLRQQFAKTGNLTGDIDANFRTVEDREPVCAFSYTFAKDASSSGPRTAIFSLALVQDPIVQFAATDSVKPVTPLWMSYFDDAGALLRFHHADFSNARALAAGYSGQLRQDAASAAGTPYGGGYVDLTALSARQVLGATQFGGTPAEPLLFLKEISSNGNMQTVDVIFPAFPFFLYTNPRWLAYLLQPLLEYQLSGQYPNDYSIHDLGTHFPNATGHPDGADEYMPVEECGNMLIMALALANSLRRPSDASPPPSGPALTNATSSGIISLDVDELGMDRVPDVDADPAGEARRWLSRNYKLWKQWVGYLVAESLVPANQLSTDDFAGWLANQTNLALKGIIGIRAMSEIAAIVAEDEDAAGYRATAEEYIDKWVGYGASRDGTHAKLAYTWYGSWTTLYNLFADALLCFHLGDDGSSNNNSTTAVSATRSMQGLKIRNETNDSQKSMEGDRDEDPENGVVVVDGNNASRQGFVPRNIYIMQSKWYAGVLQRYGLPLDSRHLYAKSDWEMFAAAVSSAGTRAAILDSMALWVNETATDKPLTDLYNTEGDGGFPDPDFFARPVVGGHFALLALERACEGKAVQGLRFLDGE